MPERLETMLERVLAHPRPEALSFAISMALVLYGDVTQESGVFIVGFVAAAFSWFWLFVRDVEHHLKERNREEFERWQRDRDANAR